MNEVDVQRSRAEKAEAEVQRLRALLRILAETDIHLPGCSECGLGDLCGCSGKCNCEMKSFLP